MKKSKPKYILLAVAFSCILGGGCKDECPNFVVLLNADTVHSKDLRKLYDANALNYIQYEGFQVFTSDTIFGNPILLSINSVGKIESDVLPDHAIRELLLHPIKTITYKLKIDSINSIDHVLEKLSKLYSISSDISGSTWKLRKPNFHNAGKVDYNPAIPEVSIYLYPE